MILWCAMLQAFIPIVIHHS